VRGLEVEAGILPRGEFVLAPVHERFVPGNVPDAGLLQRVGQRGVAPGSNLLRVAGAKGIVVVQREVVGGRDLLVPSVVPDRLLDLERLKGALREVQGRQGHRHLSALKLLALVSAHAQVLAAPRPVFAVAQVGRDFLIDGVIVVVAVAPGKVRGGREVNIAPNGGGRGEILAVGPSELSSVPVGEVGILLLADPGAPIGHVQPPVVIIPLSVSKDGVDLKAAL
jgi:hypothetical protein